MQYVSTFAGQNMAALWLVVCVAQLEDDQTARGNLKSHLLEDKLSSIHSSTVRVVLLHFYIVADVTVKVVNCCNTCKYLTVLPKYQRIKPELHGVIQNYLKK